jgi:hypothetical protein
MLNLGHLISLNCQLLAESCLHTAPSTELARKVGQDSYREFLTEVQRSPLLQREYVVFTNLQQQGIAPELLREYVEVNLRQLQGNSLGALRQAHERLGRFSPTGNPTPLNEAIQTLICEHLAPAGQQRVSAYYQALRLVTESLGQPVGHPEALPVSSEGESLPQLLSGAVGALAETLQPLTESERQLVLTLNSGDEEGKKALFETYRTRAGELLQGHEGTAAHTRQQQMRYNPATAHDDLLDLHEFIYEE